MACKVFSPEKKSTILKYSFFLYFCRRKHNYCKLNHYCVQYFLSLFYSGYLTSAFTPMGAVLPTYLTPKPKFMETPNFVLIVMSRPLFSKNNVIFTMTSQADQILYVGLFFDTLILNHKMHKSSTLCHINIW